MLRARQPILTTIVDSGKEQKGKAMSVQGSTSPEGSTKLRHPDIKENWHMKVVRLSALGSGYFTLQEIFLALISVRG